MPNKGQAYVWKISKLESPSALSFIWNVSVSHPRVRWAKAALDEGGQRWLPTWGTLTAAPGAHESSTEPCRGGWHSPTASGATYTSAIETYLSNVLCVFACSNEFKRVEASAGLQPCATILAFIFDVSSGEHTQSPHLRGEHFTNRAMVLVPATVFSSR